MEKAVLESLGQFSDTELVALHLATVRSKGRGDRERGLKEVQKALAEALPKKYRFRYVISISKQISMSP
jgi:hypothetical protein